MIKISKTDILVAQKGLCFFCGLPMDDYGDTETSCTVDHFYPKTRGGRTHNNLVLVHGKCNREKSGRLPTDLETFRFNALYDEIRATKATVEKLRKMWARPKKKVKRVKYDKHTFMKLDWAMR